MPLGTGGVDVDSVKPKELFKYYLKIEYSAGLFYNKSILIGDVNLVLLAMNLSILAF